MDVLSIIAWGVVAAAALYLGIALITWPQRRRQRLADEAGDPHSHPTVHINDRSLQPEEPTPDRMRKLAGIFAAIAARVWNEPFDFTVESIAAVDRAIIAGWGDEAPDADEEVVLAFGAYVGEVLVRRTRGRWVSGYSDEDPATVLLLSPGREDAVNFSPFQMVREKFQNPWRFDLQIAFTALEQKLKELQAA